jgi:hypothetical protein
MSILLTPTTGGMFVSVDGDEQFKLMSSNGMLVLAERLIIAARDTYKSEMEASSYAEAVHALR